MATTVAYRSPLLGQLFSENGERNAHEVSPYGLHQAAPLLLLYRVSRPGFCSEHTKDGMVNVMNKRGAHSGSTIRARFDGAGGQGGILLWTQEGRMVDIKSRRCAHGGTKLPSYGVAGTKKVAEFCSAHKKDGTVNLASRMCTNYGCNKQPSFGIAGTVVLYNTRILLCTQERRHGGCREQELHPPWLQPVPGLWCCRQQEHGVVLQACDRWYG